MRAHHGMDERHFLYYSFRYLHRDSTKLSHLSPEMGETWNIMCIYAYTRITYIYLPSHIGCSHALEMMTVSAAVLLDFSF